MAAFIRETGTAAPIEGRNVDTDQIIPARFIKSDRAKGYGQFLFHDARFDSAGREIADFVLNREPFRHARILVADANFGCGSSREGAVYALHDFGIRAVLAPSFGDIFYNNCLKNGIVPVGLPENVTSELRRGLEGGVDRDITVDLETSRVTLPDRTSHDFRIDPFWRECLMKGVDEIELTLGCIDQIESFERTYYAAHEWART